jgi:hypothetical protein
LVLDAAHFDCLRVPLKHSSQLPTHRINGILIIQNLADCSLQNLLRPFLGASPLQQGSERWPLMSQSLAKLLARGRASKQYHRDIFSCDLLDAFGPVSQNR